jgi:hypothetical protein
MYGRHSEAPLPVVAAYSPANCFDTAIEAARIALKYRTPVIRAQRRLHRQRQPSRGASPTSPRCPTSPCSSPPSSTTQRRLAPRSSGRTCAIRDPGPPVGHPRHAEADAPRRRPREEDGAATSATRPRTTSGCRPARRRRSPGIRSNDNPARSGSRRCDSMPMSACSAGGRRGCHRRCRAAHASPRRQGGVGFISPISTAAPKLGEVLKKYRELSCRAQPRSAVSIVRPSTSRRKAVTKVRACPSTARELETDDRRSVCNEKTPSCGHHQEGLDQRPGGRWCPGCGDYGILLAVQQLMPELGVRPENTGVHQRHRLQQPLPVLHEHVRHARHPRPRPGDRHRPRRRPPRPRRLGDHR